MAAPISNEHPRSGAAPGRICGEDISDLEGVRVLGRSHEA
jgi:hypothetical protein